MAALRRRPFWDLYEDAFWRVVPVPAAAAGAALTVAWRPSPEAVLALALLVLVGTAVEVVVWRALLARWARGEISPEHPWVSLALLGVVMAGAATVKFHDAEEGTSWAEAARSSLILTAVLVGLGVAVRLYERSTATPPAGTDRS